MPDFSKVRSGSGERVALELYGHNWKLVEKHVGTRSGTQVRSHAQKYFLKVDNRERKAQGTREEEASSLTARKNSSVLPLEEVKLDVADPPELLTELLDLRKCAESVTAGMRGAAAGRHMPVPKETADCLETVTCRLRSLFPRLALCPRLCARWSEVMALARRGAEMLLEMRKGESDEGKKA